MLGKAYLEQGFRADPTIDLHGVKRRVYWYPDPQTDVKIRSPGGQCRII